MGDIDITEQLNSPVSYLEMHGLSYAGVATGTIDDYLSAAPYINKRSPFGRADFIQGYVVNNQTENNQIVGDVFAHRNAKFPSVNVKLAGWYSLFDIAPEECVTLTTIRQDTVRGVVWNKKSFLMREMGVEADPKNKILLPTINLYEVTQGTPGATVPIPTPVEPPVYPEFPPITGGWTLPWPWDWPKPWIEPLPGDDCRGNPSAPRNGPYGLGFSKSQLSSAETTVAFFPCYIRMAGARSTTKISIYGITYDPSGWNGITVQAVNSSQSVLATAICIEDHGFPGAITYGVYEFSSMTGFEVAGFKITAPTIASSANYFSLGNQISAGSVAATDVAGVAVGGMTVGQLYAIENTGGPYTPQAYPNQLSFGGVFKKTTAWDRFGIAECGPGADHTQFNQNDYAFHGPDGLFGEFIDGPNGVRARVYFTASQSTYYWACRQLEGAYPLMVGSLGYILKNVMLKALTINSAIIENVCL